MVNLKTKSEKHVNDNEKRRQSLKEREKAKLNQSQIIKQALSNATLQNNSSTKITFSDEDEENNDSKDINVRKNLNSSYKSSLFDNSESSENEDFKEFKEKIYFSGKKGFELLNLQSTYGNDERFKIDERFYEEETKNSDEEEDKISDPEIKSSKEKTKHLKILEDVLGTPFKPEKERKSKKRVYEMVRYDVSNKDHKIFEIDTQSSAIKSSLKKKKEKKATGINSENIYKAKVSKEKFYEVSSEIKNQLKRKENGPFSILETYGVNDVADDQEFYLSGTEHKEDSGSDLNEIVDERDCEINYDYKEHKQENEKLDQPQVNGFKAKGIWKEPFFFDQEDIRFKDALEFINKKNSEAATEAAENYEKTRKKLKEILRLHLKKHMHKRDPFKTKIGGMNKKQLSKTRFKNQKMTFNKRNIPKKSPAKKI